MKRVERATRLRQWRRASGRGLLLCTSLCLTACPPTPPVPQNIVVSFTGASAAGRPLLLYSGVSSAACEAFEPSLGSGGTSVTIDAVSWDATCGAEFDLFTPAAGAFARRVEATNPEDVAWLSAAIAAGKTTIDIPPLLKLPVTLWIVAQSGGIAEATAMRDRQVLSANALMQELGVGMALDIKSPIIAPGSVAPDCKESNATSGSATVFDKGRINVYYVRQYLDKPYTSYGYTCWMQGHPDVIFSAWGDAQNPDVVLAHELGHALGLVHPINATPTTVGGGHTDNVPGFDNENLMRSGGAAVTNISIGQMYAMNFSKSSWLNRPSAVSQSVVRACPDAWVGAACPALTLFQPGWPP